MRETNYRLGRLRERLAELQLRAAADPDTPRRVLLQLAEAGRSDVQEVLVARYMHLDSGTLRLRCRDDVDLLCAVFRHRRVHVPDDALKRLIAEAVESVPNEGWRAQLRAVLDHNQLERVERTSENAVEKLEDAHRRAKAAPDLLREACWKTRALEWESAAIYLYESQWRVLELVTSTGPAVSSVHALGLPESCDVEALVFRNCQAHVHRGGGYRKHYSRYIYETMAHERFRTRMFVVIGVLLDGDGRVVRNALEWERVSPGDVAADSIWAPCVPAGCRFEPLGTMSLSSERVIDEGRLRATFRLLGDVGIVAFEAQLRSLASTVHRQASALCGVEKTALYLFQERNALDLLDPTLRRPFGVCYEGNERRSTRREIDPEGDEYGGTDDPFIGDGLGAEVLRVGKAIVFERSGDMGIERRLMASERVTVFPLRDGLGLFYAHDCPSEVSADVAAFLRRASHAISMALLEESQLRARRGREALALMGSALSPSGPSHAEHVANFALGFLGADVVTVIDSEGVAVAGQPSMEDRRGARQLARVAGTFDVVYTHERGDYREAYGEEGAGMRFRELFSDPRKDYRHREQILVTVVVRRRGGQTLIVDYRRRVRFDGEHRKIVACVAQFCDESSTAHSPSRSMGAVLGARHKAVATVTGATIEAGARFAELSSRRVGHGLNEAVREHAPAPN